MIKKRSQKELANKFRAAATAANAFKPRAGGAGERFKSEVSKIDSSDGIHGVFKAPSVAKDAIRSPAITPGTEVQLNPIESEAAMKDSVSSLRSSDVTADPVAREEPRVKDPEVSTPAKDDPPMQVAEERKKKRPSNNSARFAEVLGIPAVLLEGRTADIEACLEDINWGPDEKKRIKSDDLLLESRKELSKAETGTWLSSFEQGDDRVAAVSKMLDKAIEECDELDGLLTLYDAELGVSLRVRDIVLD